MQLTTVALDLVQVDYSVMAEMSDGTVHVLSVPWGQPDPVIVRGWRYKTREQLTELARAHNTVRRLDMADRLHLDKVRRLGHDYRARGY